jgi:hypothetical protein
MGGQYWSDVIVVRTRNRSITQLYPLVYRLRTCYYFGMNKGFIGREWGYGTDELSRILHADGGGDFIAKTIEAPFRFGLKTVGNLMNTTVNGIFDLLIGAGKKGGKALLTARALPLPAGK